ncbi:MAG: hypothetical protein AAF736_10135 [Pseudomonadota bacterium]
MSIRFESATLILLVVSSTLLGSGVGATETRFTYQGRLSATGAPLEQSVDVRFEIYDEAVGGVLLAEPQTQQVDIASGIFSVELDFGPAIVGAQVWLQVAPRGLSTGDFTPLLPRQQVVAMPLAGATAAAAPNSVGTTQLERGAVTAGKIAAGAVTTRTLATASINDAKLGFQSVTTATMQADSVREPQISRSAVQTVNLKANAATNPAIANAAVTSSELLDRAVAGDHVAAGAVTRTQLAAAAVGSTELAGGAIGSAELANGAVGVSQVKTSEVQARIPGCQSGGYFQGPFLDIGSICPSDDLGITGFGSPLGYSVSSFNSGGTNSVTMTNASTHVCILSKYDVRDVDNAPVEFAACRVSVSAGAWILSASTPVGSGLDADALCEALCFELVYSP